MDRIDTQVVVLGGGCGGLWLLHELVSTGYPSLLIEYGNLGDFASTHNQSWLHSGALYAVIAGETEREGNTKLSPLWTTAQACRPAFEEVRRFYPEALESQSECLFLFDTEGGAKVAQQQIRELDPSIRTEIIDQHGIAKAEPMLAPVKRLEAGLLTQDLPFNSQLILARLAERATAKGADFHISKSGLKNIKVSRQDRWMIKDQDFVATAQTLVSATGALIPEMREVLGDDDETEMKKDYCLVAVLHQRICNRIIVTRTLDSRLLNLVPFRGGTTVNLGSMDKPHPREIGLKLYEFMAERLTQYVPGLRQLECQAHFYICEKIANISTSSHPKEKYGKRHYFWKDAGNSLFHYYPGKFTLAPIAAKEFVDFLSRSGLTPWGIRQSKITSLAPSVASRPYYDSSTHILRFSKEKMHLVFDEIRG